MKISVDALNWTFDITVQSQDIFIQSLSISSIAWFEKSIFLFSWSLISGKFDYFCFCPDHYKHLNTPHSCFVMLTDLHCKSLSSEDVFLPMTILHPITLQSAPVLLENSLDCFSPEWQLLHKLPVLMWKLHVLCGEVVIVEIQQKGRHTEALFVKALSTIKGIFAVRSYLASLVDDVMPLFLCVNISRESVEHKLGSHFSKPLFDCKISLQCNLE